VTAQPDRDRSVRCRRVVVGRERARVLFEQFTWRHPEWWTLLLALAAWTFIAMAAFDRGATATVPSHQHVASTAALQTLALADLMSVAVLMTLAMMLPLAVPMIRRVAFSNFRYRTDRSVAMFSAGYFAVWTGAATAIGAAVGIVEAALGFPLTLAVALITAVLWQRAAIKRRALRRCDIPIALAAHGWRADREHIVLGLVLGRRCVLTCWAAMALLDVVGHQPLLMLVAVAGLARDRYGRWVFHHLRAVVTREARWAWADMRPSRAVLTGSESA
jgi:predicted metal-binding membrane protein